MDVMFQTSLIIISFLVKIIMKDIPNSRLECKSETFFKTKTAKIDTLFLAEMAKTPHPWGHTYLYSPYTCKGPPSTPSIERRGHNLQEP